MFMSLDSISMARPSQADGRLDWTRDSARPELQSMAFSGVGDKGPLWVAAP